MFEFYKNLIEAGSTANAIARFIVVVVIAAAIIAIISALAS
ncbi:MAG TPA: hypothetical protein VEI97_20480 [bacterium]|nr:hypothetical protein [bacterium]